MLRLFLPLFIFTSLPVYADIAPTTSVSRADYQVHDYSEIFKEYGVKGSFALYNLKAGTYIYSNPERCKTPFIPASTFKIPNSLIGLETGVIKDANHLMKWDGVKSNVSEDWNRDHTLKTAFKYSVVWYYQELARMVGQKRMQSYLQKMDYGNKNISGGIDRFWLDGGLRISQKQQLEFLKKLYLNQLPFSKKTINTVKEIMAREKKEGYTVSGKTGWARPGDNNIGWYVGYVEKAGNVYFFATNAEISSKNKNYSSEKFLRLRLEITDKILKDLGII